MKKEQTRYIVKRNYNASRTGADAFIKLIKKDKSKYENIDIEYTQYNIENDKKVCYTPSLPLKRTKRSLDRLRFP